MKVPERVKYALKSISNLHRQGNEPNVFLFATPRGGSTWVMELLASQPGMKYYDEPFNIRRDNVARAGLFRDWESLMPDTGDSERVIQFLNDLAAGRHSHMNAAPFRPHHRVLTNRIVFKLHELEHLIGRIAAACRGQIVYLLRHPIPTTLSRRVFPRLELFLSSRYYDALIDDPRRLKEITAIGTKGSHLDRGIVSWCYENVIPLRHRNFEGLFVAYEELVLNPIRSCDLLLQYLTFGDREAMLRAFSEPAANIEMSSKETQTALTDADERRRRHYLVSKWRKKSTPEDMDRVTSILELFRLDVYRGDQILPHPRYLHFKDTTDLVVEEPLAAAAGTRSA